MALGRPKGSLNQKPWANALRRAVGLAKPSPDGVRALDRLARAAVKKGEEGDVAAMREIGDRIDGKVPQATENDTRLTGTLTVKWQ